jgi:hypothetical protein
MLNFALDWPNLIAGSILSSIVFAGATLLWRYLSKFSERSRIYVHSKRREQAVRNLTQIRRLRQDETSLWACGFGTLARLVTLGIVSAVSFILCVLLGFLAFIDALSGQRDVGLMILIFILFIAGAIALFLLNRLSTEAGHTLSNYSNFTAYEEEVQRRFGVDDAN